MDSLRSSTPNQAGPVRSRVSSNQAGRNNFEDGQGLTGDRFTPSEGPPPMKQRDMQLFFQASEGAHNAVTIIEGANDWRKAVDPARKALRFEYGLTGPLKPLSGSLRMLFPDGSNEQERRLDQAAGLMDGLSVSRVAARWIGPFGHAVGATQHFNEAKSSLDRNDPARATGMFLASSLEGMAAAASCGGPAGILVAGGLGAAATVAEVATKLATKDEYGR